MKHLKVKLLLLVMGISLFFVACDNEDDAPAPTVVNSKVYQLGAVGTSGVTGTATIIEKSDATLSVELELKNTVAGASHPAHIHLKTAAETGSIALSLNAVDGTTGKSTTVFNALDNGIKITYQELLNFNGYINVHLSASNLATLVAQGDIGQNELTGKKVSYVVDQKDVAGISGTVEFAERVNQTTLVTIKLIGTMAGASHPAHIHEKNVAMGGNIIAGLNPVNGTTGISTTQVATLVGGAAVTYTQFLTRAAYVNAHLSDANMATIVAQGNIGSSVGSGAGTVETKTYTVTTSGSSSYIFNGEGLTNASNPGLTLKRGGTYTFNVNASGHPFYINTVQGTGSANAYNSGVTGNGAVSGMVKIVVPTNAPNTLYYNCEFHGLMTGTITITN